jgi:hypothetical protein
LCAQDPLLSQFWAATSSINDTVGTPTTGGLVFALDAAGLGGCVVYHSDAAINGALQALSSMLGYINDSGTPVGNSPNYNRTTGVKASGVSGANVTPAIETNLKNNKIMYFKTVGNGTASVAIYGDQQVVDGKYIGAELFKNYFNYVCQVKSAELLTDGYNPKYKNETTYREILATVSGEGYRFQNIGVLSNFAVTKMSFLKLPPASGDAYVIPNAWEAGFNRRVQKVTVQGSLYIQA